MLRIAEPTIAELMALCGVDIIVLDNEHYPFNDSELVNIIRAAQAGGTECLVTGQFKGSRHNRTCYGYGSQRNFSSTGR